jgi:Flp pilus assembly protein TadB
MVEGLIIILICAFVTVIAAIIAKVGLFMIILQFVIAGIVIYLLIRVRVKISKAEKENLRAHIDELEKKIDTLTKKNG